MLQGGTLSFEWGAMFCNWFCNVTTNKQATAKGRDGHGWQERAGGRTGAAGVTWNGRMGAWSADVCAQSSAIVILCVVPLGGLQIRTFFKNRGKPKVQ